MGKRRLWERFKGRGPLINIVLDGWGIGAHDEGDALYQANTPTLRSVMERCPTGIVYTHGLHVGLPSPKDIGGSEVGHMAMGAGLILPQGPTRIQRAIASGDFFRGEVLNRLLSNCLERPAPLHLIGLLSDGNVHSHLSHFERIIDHAAQRGVRRLYVHALLDGRDVPYQSALDYVEPLEARFAAIARNHPGFDYAIASGGGREVITMDRDRNWEKVRRGWEVHVRGREGLPVEAVAPIIREFRERTPDVVDQDLPPFVVMRNGEPIGRIEDGHSVIFMNFRGDRAVEFSRAMVEEDFREFDRGPKPEVLYAGMALYDEDTDLPPNRLISPESVAEPFGKRILELGLRQFRLAETQKYAHVTLFFNGGYREPLDPERERYQLIPSDKVNSFAEAPAMKAREIGEAAATLIRSGEFDFGLINFANADMVGHTGNLAAAIKAAEAVDGALARIVAAIEEAGGMALITADHGNAEEMISANPKTGKREPNTRHSLNPVPVALFDPLFGRDGSYRIRDDEAHPNTLSNLFATNYLLLGREPPEDVDAPLIVEV
ncbi:MAG: 2,3-bisphosphoglycerate-independent phosphoglycerate mutase [SAR324 cluster bacterium]|nr:2,3-bisphosphoglycerate-independent phosphoglycerate mutase [SAR324 cluster bacterium]